MARKQAGRGGRARAGARKKTRGAAAGAKRRPARKQARSRKAAARRTARPAKKSAGRNAAPRAKSAPKRKALKKNAPRPRKKAPKATQSSTGKTTRASAATEAARPADRSSKRDIRPKRGMPSLERSRRHLTEVEDNIPTPPSSLDLDRTPTAARSGRQAILTARSQHNETGPELTGGDVDADWEDAYAVGDEAPGGDNPTPDQDRVDDIGRALGVEYQDNEELKGSDKIAGRDKHRWELDPASAEDYRDRDEE